MFSAFEKEWFKKKKKSNPLNSKNSKVESLSIESIPSTECLGKRKKVCDMWFSTRSQV